MWSVLPEASQSVNFFLSVKHIFLLPGPKASSSTIDWRTSAFMGGIPERVASRDPDLKTAAGHHPGIDTLVISGSLMDTRSVRAHSFRATGITNFLENDGTLEAAQRIAGHADSRTTKLYDRRGQKVLLEDMERIRY